MNDATCKTCPYCEPLGSARSSCDGECHRTAPLPTRVELDSSEFFAIWPMVIMESDWCGEHPNLAPKMESVVGSIGCVTKDDVKLIVAQAIEAEMRRATQAQRAYPRHTKAT